MTNSTAVKGRTPWLEGVESDYLKGGAGADIMAGGSGNDYLNGGNGNDNIQ